MEKDNKEIIENAERKENNTEKKEQSDKKNGNRRKILWITLGIVLALCLGIFIFIRINMTETHVYEEVENLGEREGVCFDNLLLSCTIGLYDNSREINYRYLCIFNTGDVYSFEWLELTPWNYWYPGDKEHDYKIGYDETVWEKMYNVVYMGKLSNWDRIHLNQYIQSYDIESEYYNIWYDPMPIPNGGNQQNQEQIEDAIWRIYIVRIYLSDKEDYRGIVIESSDMNYLGNGMYEKGEIDMKAYDENAITALELFESSEFYDRWVAMCLNNG